MLRGVDLHVRVVPVVVGVAAGLLAGQVVALEQLAAGLSGGFERPGVLLFAALVGIGTTVVSAALGEVSADAAPAWRSTKLTWTAVLLVNSLLFATMLWATQTVQSALDFAGWGVTSAFLVTAFASPLTLLTAATAAVLVGWSLWRTRAESRTPMWLVASGDLVRWPVTRGHDLPSTTLVGLIVGAAAGLVMVALRALVGPATADAELVARFYTYQWLMAGTAATATLTLALTGPRRGAALGLLAGPVAVLTAAACFLTLNTALGGDLDAAFVTSVGRGPMALGLLLSLLVAPVGLSRSSTPHRVARSRNQRTLAATLGVSIPVLVLLARGLLTGPHPQNMPAAPSERPRAEAFVELGIEQYVLETADDIARRGAAIDELLLEIDQDASARPERAARIRAELLPLTRDQLDAARGYETSDDVIAAVHQHSVSALESMIEASELYASAVETNDPDLLARANAAMGHAQQSWSSWHTGLQAIVETAPAP